MQATYLNPRIKSKLSISYPRANGLINSIGNYWVN
jgi:hypothetical protein